MSAFRLVGVLHLPPLPGAANYGGACVREMAKAAAADAKILEAAGFTDVMVQDASDNPQPSLVGAPTVAALAVVGAAVRAATSLGLGVIVGHNDGAASVAVAHAVGAQFVRVKVLTGVSAGPTGFIQGCSLQVAQMKRLLGSEVEVWADAHEATSASLLGDTPWAAAQAVAFGGADKLIVTRDSGVGDAIDDIARVKAELGAGIDVLVGGRVTAESLPAVLRGADGAILGSVLKTSGGSAPRIDAARADHLGSLYRDSLPR
ncbi:BtpA/SgcQ family protein [Pedococcus soli]